MESATHLTTTQREQLMVQEQVFNIYRAFYEIPPRSQSFLLELQRDNHIEYLTRGLAHLAPSFCVLDANRPWLCYWILHSIALLGDCVDAHLEEATIEFLSRCQDPDGGYCGGPGQMPHLATTYAAVNTLVTLGTEKALSSINRDKLHMFLRRMKDPDGAFRMHEGGEIDVRACYTAISVASILNILDDGLVQNVGDYILSCQTYEGGIAGEPGSEAHGGYTFCGLATMILINETNRLDLYGLTDWVVFRQGVEGGFQGRTNKLVDGCYSFWQGGVFALLKMLHLFNVDHIPSIDAGVQDGAESPKSSASLDIKVKGSDIPERGASHVKVEGSVGTSSDIDDHSDDEAPHDSSLENMAPERRMKVEPLFNGLALQQYIVLCAQDPGGGLRDKPGKARDFYHTCYCLSGLSVCQHSWSKDEDSLPLPSAVLGPYSNLLEPIHPLYNVVVDRYREACEFFSKQL